MRKTSIILIVLFCILFIYIITIQTIKGCYKRSFRKRVRRLNNLDISSNIIRQRFSGMGIYYINLNKATDRRKDVETFIQQHKIENIQRIEGVYGKNIKDNTYTFSDGREIQIKNEYPSSVYNDGQLGCFLSHVVALKTAYENGDEYAVILEDDVDMNLVKVWEDGLMEVIHKAPGNWNIIQLFEHFNKRRVDKNEYVSREYEQTQGTLSYLIKRDSIIEFLKYLQFLEGNTVYIKKTNSNFPIDWYLYNFFPPGQVYTTQTLFIPNNISKRSQIVSHGLGFYMDSLFWFATDDRYLNASIHYMDSFNNTM